MAKTFLELHEYLIDEGLIAGLCCELYGERLLHPLFVEYFDELRSMEYIGPTGVYTPLRQNIVLLLAAINGEL